MHKISFFLLVCLLAINICGCWDYRDLEDQDLPIIASYDKVINPPPGAEDYQRIVLGTLTPLLSTGKEGKVRIMTTAAPVVGMSREERAWSLISNYNPTMIQTTIYGEDIARQGLQEGLDITLRTPKIKHTILMAVVEGRAEEMLKMEINDDVDNTGTYLLYLLKGASNRGFMVSTTMHQFAVNYMTDGKNPVLPTIKAGDKEIVITGTAIFDGGKMIDKIGRPETRALILLRGLESGGYIPYSFSQEGRIERGTVFVKNQRSVKVEREGDQYNFLIKIKLSGIVVEKTSERSLLKNHEGLKIIEDTVAAYVEKDCQRFIERMQDEFKIDCIDINKYAMAKWRNELQGKADEKVIPNASIKVEVKVKLDNFGERL